MLPAGKCRSAEGPRGLGAQRRDGAGTAAGGRLAARALPATPTPDAPFPQSVASTRWMLQDEMRLRNTDCDNCIIGTMFAAQYLACLCWVSSRAEGRGGGGGGVSPTPGPGFCSSRWT